ncbi:glycosyltransferase family 9 protein [Winogradskyella endarachnes]|uniref:Lipopolysaccharide heptosyltransferase family protein n=1 Tax=Winogradskyella endarachnes TaxID=2681965 RepID=A0A6L6U7K6_9FLAO|nr:glycosyltransferase family 9 protein [Winogradskyella endarachnes]MUU78138.1 lipopolysaccharide heptosyltransferase family protein [Winogradskyella endarachnes]
MKILIIQQKMIGDVLATSILFEAIKKTYPNADLHYVINSHTFPVVENNPFIDKIHFFTPVLEKSKFQLYKFAKTLKKENFDVVIDVYIKLSSKLISYLSNAKTKISIDKGNKSFIYNHTFKHKLKADTNAGLAIENRLQLLQPLKINPLEIVKPKIYLTEKEKLKAKQFLKSNGIDLNKPLFMIGVLGSGYNKTYPFKYMAKVIDKLAIEEPEGQIIFNYIPKQEKDAKAILELCATETQNQIYFNVFGKSLRDFLAITSHCNALIGNEGGAINMAKALDIPTFTIFSPWIKKEAWNMFDDGKKHVSVHLKDYKEQVYLNIQHPKALKSKASELYLEFKPSNFKEELNTFLKRIN